VTAGGGINTGGAEIEDCGPGVKEPLLERPPAIGCPPVKEDGCEGVIGVFGAACCAGVKAPEVLPIGVIGMRCPPFDDKTDGGCDWDIEAGGGVDALTIGNPGEDGVPPADILDGRGVRYVGRFTASAG
jgi:hypothetical protein